jgi:hypothetical protein
MKASQLIAQLSTAIAEHGDFSVMASRDQEGNGYNDIRGVAVVFQSTEDPDNIWDHECEAQDDCGDEYEVKVLVYV